MLRPVEFTGDVGKAVNSIRLRLLGRRLPPALYHYTSSDAVLNIGTSRVLWATSATDLEDATEIEYGAELVQEQVERKVKSGIAAFPEMNKGLRAGQNGHRVGCSFEVERQNVNTSSTDRRR